MVQSQGTVWSNLRVHLETQLVKVSKGMLSVVEYCCHDIVDEDEIFHCERR